MRRVLPPLNACRSFEAAALESSFARAGERLHVSAAAVSQQVKQLENWLGHKLFYRGHSGLVLTERGRTFLVAVREGLTQIARGVEDISGAAIAPTLTVGVAPNFALRWLIPRLGIFAQEHPSMRIELVNLAHGMEVSRDRYDIAVRHLDVSATANVTNQDINLDLLFPGDTTPVASPSLVSRTYLRNPRDLAKCTLLHISAVPDEWARWLAVAGVTDVDARKGPYFDSYAMVVEAAVSGWGVALAREDFIAGDLGSKRLIIPFKQRLPSNSAWYLVSFKHPRAHVAAFRRWLLVQARTARRPS